MNDTVEQTATQSGMVKLESLLADAKKHPAAIDLFYDELWLPGGIIAPEMRTLMERMEAFIKGQVSLQPKYKAIAKLAEGYMQFHEGRYDSSLLILFDVQKIFTELHEDDWAQCAAAMIGCDYRTLGEVELTLKYLTEAYQHLNKAGKHEIFQAFCVYMLAETYSETGQYEEALKFHELTVNLMTWTGNNNMLARALNGIGVVYQRRHQYALALDYLTRALKLSDETKNLYVKARALTDLGDYHFEMADYPASALYQQQALHIRQELKIPNGAVTNMIHLAKISAKQNMPEEAIAMLNDALKIAEEIRVKPKMFQIHEMLSELYQAKGDMLKSLFHYKTFHLLREEVLHEDNEKKMKNLRRIIEAEQTKKENVIIKKQKEEIQAKNIELQDTIDELTITKVSRRAKAITLVIAVILFVCEDPVLGFALNTFGKGNYYLSLGIKMLIIFSLAPINGAVQNYLLKKVIKNKRKNSVQTQFLGEVSPS